MQVLSTKKLSPAQREILASPKIRVVDYDAIKIVEKPFELPSEMKSVIFTSQNSVKFFLKKAEEKDIKLEDLEAFCVGEKTTALLRKHQIKVFAETHYAEDLVKILATKGASRDFSFFCGSLRRDTIPEGLKQNEIRFTEIQMYDTVAQPQKWKEDFEAVLFYSPSGVESFFLENVFSGKTQAVCIGSTTAKAAKKFTPAIEIAEKPTVESVLEKARELLLFNKKTSGN